jgi:hypothetical protein
MFFFVARTVSQAALIDVASEISSPGKSLSWEGVPAQDVKIKQGLVSEGYRLEWEDGLRVGMGLDPIARPEAEAATKTFKKKRVRNVTEKELEKARLELLMEIDQESMADDEEQDRGSDDSDGGQEERARKKGESSFILNSVGVSK